MKPAIKALLAIEAFVCFAPAIYIWLLSLVVLPFMVMDFFNGGAVESLAGPIATILGGLGIVGAGALFVALDSGQLIISREKLWVFLVSGWMASAIGISLLGFGGVAMCVMFAAPVLASVHFLYLWRVSENAD